MQCTMHFFSSSCSFFLKFDLCDILFGYTKHIFPILIIHHSERTAYPSQKADKHIYPIRRDHQKFFSYQVSYNLNIIHPGTAGLKRVRQTDGYFYSADRIIDDLMLLVCFMHKYICNDFYLMFSIPVRLFQ